MANCVAATSSSGVVATSNRAVSCRRSPRSASANSTRASTSSAFFRRLSASRSADAGTGCCRDGTAFLGLGGRLGMISIPLYGAWSIDDQLDRLSLDRRASDQRVSVVPRHPTLGARGQLLGVLLQLGQVVERVRPVQLARVDQ